MSSRIRKFMRENREKPFINFLYRHLKSREKRKHLRLHPPEVVVDLRGAEEFYRHDSEWLQLIRNHIRGKTLDIGSKYGLVTEGNDVVALDIVRDYLLVNIHKDRILADACGLPFLNEGFSTIVATEILEHLEHPRKAIDEMKRVLKHEGQIVISVPDRYNSFSEPSHLHYFTESKVCGLFKDFEVVVCKTISTGHIFGVFTLVR